MKKKLFSLVMAVAMVLSLAVPAFAANYWSFASDSSDSATQTIRMEGKTFVPTISLTLPNITADPMILNPYKIEYKGAGATLNAQAVFSADYTNQVICPIYAIKNNTNAKMNVKVAATTTAGGQLALVNSHVALDATAKQAFVNLIVQKTSTTSAPGAASSDGTHIDTASALTKLDAYDTANNTVITLAATNPAQQAATLEVATASAANYLLFQFDGELARNPNDAWKDTDKLTTTLTFTFSPVSVSDAVASLNNNGVFGNTALAKTTLGTDANKQVQLPVLASSGSIDNKQFATFAVNPSGTNYTLSLSATDIGWSIVDKGSFPTMTIGGTADAPILNIPGADLNLLPKDGQAHDYKFVLGFNDKNGVPRTVEVTATITRAAA